MAGGVVPVAWVGEQAVVGFPGHVDASKAGEVRDRLLAVIGQGASVVIADMSATESCDPAVVDALARAYQQAAVRRAELRLVATAAEIWQVLSAGGLDRLVPVYLSLEAAAAGDAGPSAQPGDDRSPTGPGPARGGDGQAGHDSGPGAAAMSAVVLRQLVDALGDGIALTDDNGMIVLANRRLAGLFGYDLGELPGQPVESLVPVGLREGHRRDRAAYALAPTPRPMGDRVRMVGLRKDGGTVPVSITLSPVPVGDGHFVLAVVRDRSREQQSADLAYLAGYVAAGQEQQRGQDLLGRVSRHLFLVGLSLQAAVDLPDELARERIIEALQQLDDTIRDVRDHVFSPSDAAP